MRIYSSHHLVFLLLDLVAIQERLKKKNDEMCSYTVRLVLDKSFKFALNVFLLQGWSRSPYEACS